MSIKTITLFAHINLISIDKDAHKVVSVKQDMEDVASVRKNIEQAVASVRRYEASGSYPLVKPNFIDDVIGHFTNGGLSTEFVLQDNSYHEIVGLPGYTRVWELPLELRDEVENSLIGFQVDYDDESWDVLDVKPIKD